MVQYVFSDKTGTLTQVPRRAWLTAVCRQELCHRVRLHSGTAICYRRSAVRTGAGVRVCIASMSILSRR